MKKGQNNNFEKDYFMTGLGGKVSYDKLIESVKNKSSAHQKAKNVARKKKKRK